MQTYIVEISAYPQEFTVTAHNEDEAVLKAQERWNQATNGASIYETKVTEEK